MVGLMAAGMCLPSWAQGQQRAVAPAQAQTVVTLDQPDAQRTREELSRLLDRCPPTLRGVLALDPTLLGNQTYLAPYPGLATFLQAHPEIASNPTFFVGEAPHLRQDPASRSFELWKEVFGGLAVFTGFGMAIGLLVWLLRTFVDYRRWIRLSKVQTDVHTKLLDRFTANDDLLSYIQSPAGSKFLESSPIKLDAAPRSISAPVGRILWSVQGGMVMMAGGIGLQVVSSNVRDEAAQPLGALGVIAIALGVGFVISAIISYVISQRLGLLEPAPPATRAEPPSV